LISKAFVRYLKKAFDINALPGETQINANLSGGSGSFGDSDGSSSGGSSSGGGGESSTSLSSSTSIWEAMQANIETMLSSEGKMVVSESTGKIIVKDRPYIVEEVEDYINKENADFRKQVMVNVKVLSISRSRGAGYDINWNAVSASLSSDLSFGLSGGGALNLDSGAAVISGAVDDGNAFEGSEAVVRAINSNTDSSLLTNVFVSTMNGQPAPLQVVKKQAYIKSVGTTTTETSTTSNIEQGTVNTGFSISLLPKIMNDDHILLQYSINLSDLQNLESVSSGDQTVQTPEIDTRDFLQKMSIKSGDTLVISGFERVVSTYEKEIGGSTEALDNDMIVIIMTPVIVNR
jgi:type IVB pilus formation R64 PilN family outer membrane protein